MRASKLFFALRFMAGVLAGGGHGSEEHHSVDDYPPDDRDNGIIWTFPPPHEKRQVATPTPCNPLDPGCWLSKRDSPIFPRDDWTEWACTRGVQWACNYPDIDKRETSWPWDHCHLAEDLCDWGYECGCDYLEQCDENEDVLFPDGLIPDSLQYCACMAGIGNDDHCNDDDFEKREEDSFSSVPVTPGQATTLTTEIDHKPVTMAMSVAQTSPMSMVWKAAADDTTITWDASVLSDNPQAMVVKTILDGHSSVSTLTLDTPFDAVMTMPAVLNKRAKKRTARHHEIVVTLGTAEGEVQTAVATLQGHALTNVESVIQTSPLAVMGEMVMNDMTSTGVISAMSTDARVVEFDAVIEGKTTSLGLARLDEPFVPGAKFTFPNDLAKREEHPTSEGSQPSSKSGDASLSTANSIVSTSFESQPHKTGPGRSTRTKHPKGTPPTEDEGSTSKHGNPRSKKHQHASKKQSMSSVSLSTANLPSSSSGKVKPNRSSKSLSTVNLSSSPSGKAKPHSSSVNVRIETISSLDNNPPLIVKKIISGAHTTTVTSSVGVWPAMSPKMVKRGADGVETVTILDQQPGHSIMNKVAADSSTTGVTVVDDHGTRRTLRPTTDSEGRTILVTEDPHVHHSHRSTCTVTLVHNKSGELSTIMPSETAVDMVTTTKHVLASGHHTLIPTTDDEGNDIFVTETIDSPSSTTTMQLFSLTPLPKVEIPSRPATVTKVITQTITRPAGNDHRHRYDMRHFYDYEDDCHCEWRKQTETSADLGTTIIEVTKALQTHNNTVIIVPRKAEATLMPLIQEEVRWEGWEHLKPLSMKTTRELYPDADWEEIMRMAHHLHPRNDESDPEMRIKYAFITWMQGRHPLVGRYHDKDYPTLSSQDPYQVTTMKALIDGQTYNITAPTTTVHGRAYVTDPLMKYKMYDPLTHAVAPTGSCHGPIKKGKHDRGEFDHGDPEDHHGKHEHRNHKHECHIERCMWDFMKPVHVTTVAPYAMYDQHGDMVYDYFTHETHLHRPHWGTRTRTPTKLLDWVTRTHEELYYPTMHTFSMLDNATAKHVVRQELPPEGLNKREKKRVADDPVCYDTASCHEYCVHHSNDGWFDPKWLLKIGLPLIGLLILGLLCCCCFMCFRPGRHGRDPEKRRESLPEKIRRMSTKNKPEEVVVNNATGTATDPATGRAVDPSTAATTAVVAGAAAGAAAAGEGGNGGQGGEGQPGGSSGDGRGTTGRRAEEGRGRVNFADGGNPGTEGAPAGGEGAPASGGNAAEQAPHAAEEAPQAAEHTEPVPVHDGPADGTYTAGRQIADFGSVRGRKRNRGEGAAPGGLGIF